LAPTSLSLFSTAKQRRFEYLNTLSGVPLFLTTY
jgi:hypothetical protein